MYRVDIYKYTKCRRNGDVESTTVYIDSKILKTFKECKSYVAWETNGRKTNGTWKKATEVTTITASTGETWWDEGRGENENGFMIYKVYKGTEKKNLY